MEQLRQLLQPVQTWFSQLTTRERRLVLGASGALACFLLFVIAMSFASSSRAIRSRTETKLAQLAEVQALAVSYHEAERSRQDVERQLSSSDVQLISYLEEKGTASGMEIRSMNPKPTQTLDGGQIVENAVEIMLPDIPIERLVRFLSNVEQSPGVVKVKNIRIEPRTDTQTVASSATVATYKLKGEQ